MGETTETEAWTRDPETIEHIFHAALSEGDMVGVEASLRLMLARDPHRGIALYKSLQTGIAIRGILDAFRD